MNFCSFGPEPPLRQVFWQYLHFWLDLKIITTLNSANFSARWLDEMSFRDPKILEVWDSPFGVMDIYWAVRHHTVTTCRRTLMCSIVYLSLWCICGLSRGCFVRTTESESEAVPTPGKPSLKMRLFQAGGESRDLLCSVFDASSNCTTVTPPSSSTGAKSSVLQDNSSRWKSV